MKRLTYRFSTILVLSCISIFSVMVVKADDRERPPVPLLENTGELKGTAIIDNKFRTMTGFAKSIGVDKFSKKNKIGVKLRGRMLANETAEKHRNGYKSKPRVCFDWTSCFQDCMVKSVPLEVILACAEQCANHDWAVCATCLGAGLGIVVSCGVGCLIE